MSNSEIMATILMFSNRFKYIILWKIHEIIHSGTDSKNVLSASVWANTAMHYHAADMGLVIVSIVTCMRNIHALR